MNKNVVIALLVAVAIAAGLGLWFQQQNGPAAGGPAPVAATPPTVQFGKIFVGVTSRANASWTNNTQNPVTITGYGTTDTPPFGSPQGAFTAVVVQPGQKSPNLPFVFTPTAKGTANGSGKLLILPPGPKSDKVNLVGEGVYALNSGTVSVALTAPQTGEFVDFGRVPVGTAKTLTLSVRNSSTDDLNIQGAWAFGTRGFTRTDPAAAFVIPKNGEIVVTLSFAPSAVGETHDVIIFVNPQAPLNSGGIYVHGEGVQG